MSAVTFDPYRAEAGLRWRNRLGQWRAHRGQTLLHGFAIVALIVLLSLPLLRTLDAIAPVIRDALARWPVSLAALAWSLMAWRHAQRLVALQAQQANEWLASLPIAPRLQARRRRDRLWGDLLLHAAIGGAVLALIAAPARAYAGFIACVLLAAPSALPLSRRLVARCRRKGHLGSRIADAGTGRFWHWQRVETGVALRGRSLAFGIWALLLVPMGSGPGAVLAVALAGLLLAALSTAWQRSLGVLPQAQAWLGAQPLSGTRLLRATCAIPFGVLSIAIGLIAGVLLLLGTPGVAAFAAAGVFAIGALQFACSAAERARPRRVALVFLVHLVVLIGLLQTLPPLAAPCWVLQMFVLLRRAARP